MSLYSSSFIVVVGCWEFYCYGCVIVRMVLLVFAVLVVGGGRGVWVLRVVYYC